MSKKVYVTVNAVFQPDGTIQPLCVIWEDGTRFRIDRILTSAPLHPCAPAAPVSAIPAASAARSAICFWRETGGLSRQKSRSEPFRYNVDLFYFVTFMRS